MNNQFGLSKIMLTMLVGLIVSAGPNRVFAEEPKKEAAGEVQERAVPRLGGVGVMTPKTGGLIVQGNQLKAAPGYVLEKGPNNQVSARRMGVDGGITKECRCTGGTGNCGVATSGPIAVCSISPSGPCNGSCTWEDPIPSTGGIKGMQRAPVAPGGTLTR